MNQTTSMEHVVENTARTAEPFLELAELQLSLIGGGVGEVVLA